MAVLQILHYPDERLRVPGQDVTEFDAELKTLVSNMAETMYAAPGVGLAATQVGVAKRVFIIDIAADDEPSQLQVFVNPQIVETKGDTTFEEGCLSFPGVREEIKRAEWVKVEALDENGKPFSIESDGLLAIAIQHENDHLDGKLMLDKVGPLRRRMIQRTMKKHAETHHVHGPNCSH